ncbi:hypothetical protein Ocin01_06331 [Orchesella cincta]|uniref:Uncharacterized protein n=1 Tax=Orchesella cincta TaxID=48709 RepID=A0A1D2N4Z7_ORCCI|nr:hypothetical protein Ocin01_06331 [Orchesella cincta]
MDDCRLNIVFLIVTVWRVGFVLKGEGGFRLKMEEINSNELPSQEDEIIGATTSAAIFVDKAIEDVAALLTQKCKLLESEPDHHEPSRRSVTVSRFLKEFEGHNSQDEKEQVLSESEQRELVTESPAAAESIQVILDPPVTKAEEKNEDDDATTNVLIELLINENKQLQNRVRMTESTAAFAMSKLRQAITYLLDQPDKKMYEKQAEVLKLQKEIGQQNMEKNMEEMNLRKEVMELLLSAARIEDNMVQGYEELVTRLHLENQGLRKTLLIASEFNSPCLLTKADKSIQVDEEDLYEVLSENEGSYHTARSVYFGSDENVEDGENNSDTNDNDSVSSYSTVTARDHNLCINIQSLFR